MQCKILVVMVTGGRVLDARKSAELLSSNGTRLCSLPNFPWKTMFHTQTGLLICGGSSPRSRRGKPGACWTFSAGRWKKTHNLGQPRYGHTSWASPRGVLLMGGYYEYTRTTTELLTDNGGATPSFTLNNKRQ